jgi:carbamoyl-phosphate synthase small subunit
MEDQMTQQLSAVLVLEDGRAFCGVPYGAHGHALGEVVFCTGMTGYQETLTDPSYHGQIVVQTAPQIGNTGWNEEDGESGRIWVAGYAVRNPARTPSSWRCVRSLDAELARQGVVGMAGADTRALTRHIREHGAMRGGVFSGDALPGRQEMLAMVRASAPMTGTGLAGDVSTARPYVVPARGRSRLRVAALDLGIKSNTLRMMSARGIETHVLPLESTIGDLMATGPDGVLVSNGPGDPSTAGDAVKLTEQVLRQRIPLFGICFGHQILGQALGLTAYKLRYGHRGTNIPVVDAATGKVAITAHNHGFAIDAEPAQRFGSPFGWAQVSHHCPNDGTVEGLRCDEVPAFSVQFHPEAAAGPHDAAALLDDFAELMERRAA